MNNLLPFLVLLVSGKVFASIPVCNSHESGEIGTTISCLAPARAAGYSYFIISPAMLKKHQTYYCQFNSTLDNVTLTIVQPLANYQDLFQPHSLSIQTPLLLKINAAYMDSESRRLKIRFQLPPSDIPQIISARCTVFNPEEG